MRIILLFLLLLASAAAALPDDATLTRQLIGTWKGGRHNTRYSADGTWMMDPQLYELLGGQNTHGKWRIDNGKLITTWRFKGESEDSRTIDEIITLTADTLKIRTLVQDGPGRPAGRVLPSDVFTLTRITDSQH
jgi:hypothetical protein